MSRDATSEELLFEQALSLPEPDREGFLARVCTGNPELLAGVRDLLRALPAADELDRSIEHTLQRELASAHDALDLTGTWLGAYRITARLGEGGTGLVYRAEQDTPIRRSLALKVIKPGMDTREVLARFAAERQTLALMDHPGIARVVDAGATPDGRGYFAMELVAGVPLIRYCDEHRLPLAARLELFLQVCQAVQHAHQKGVIHRDLKPSNIVVATLDGRPQPKIIDFGIAKATAPLDSPVAAHLTQLTQFVGTPSYMSPEQVAGEADLDTRSDIYSLGALLHELLLGRTPHETKDWTQVGLDELRRRIRDDTPAAPSFSLRRLPVGDTEKISLARATPLPRLITEIAGDLDWIVLRCLEKDRNRRYPTAAALADDLRRYQQHEPVSAAAPSRVYLLRKSIRRHRVVYALGAALVLILAGATALSAVLALRARRANLAASINAATSRAALEFVRQDLLSQASPDRQPDRELKLRTALDNASTRVESRFKHQPLAEAAVRDTLGATYSSLGDYPAALVHYERAWQLLRDVHGEAHRDTLFALHNYVNALRLLSRFDDAEKLAGGSLALMRRTYGPRDPLTLDAIAGLGAMRFQQGREREAEALLLEGLEGRRAVFGPDHIKTLQSMNNYANCLANLGREAEAMPLFEHSYAVRQRTLGPEAPATLNALNSLAGSYSRGRRVAEAAELYRQCAEIRSRIQGPEHPDTLSSRQNYGSTLLQLGRWDEAAEIVIAVRQSFIRVLGPESPPGLMPLMNLGIIRANQGRYAEAEAALRECLTARRKTLGPNHAITTDAETALAETLGLAGRAEEAEMLFTIALRTRREVHGVDSLRALDTAHRYGAFLLAQQRLGEADALLADSAERSRRALGADRLDTLYLAVDAVGAKLARDLPAEAEAIALRFLEPMRTAQPRQPKRWLLEGRYAIALARQGRTTEAEPLLLKSHAGMVEHKQLLPPNEYHKIDELRHALAALYTASGRPEEAARWR